MQESSFEIAAAAREEESLEPHGSLDSCGAKPSRRSLSEANVHHQLELAISGGLDDSSTALEGQALGAAALIKQWTRTCERLMDGRKLTLKLLLCWRLQLQDQLFFQLGEERYTAGRFDEAANQLWQMLEADSCSAAAVAR